MLKDSIKRAKSSYSVGIDSSVIQKMAEEMALSGINVHSMIVLRNGEVACEGYSKPFSPETSHMMYSVSKSFLSAAYGFALSEGKVTRDTRVTDVFPEYANIKDRKLKRLTIHHLLTMTAGKQSPMRSVKTNNRIRDFINSKWLFSPGEGWRYVNENYYVASAMLTKILGESITDYLTPRLYEPLGIEVPFWEHSPDGFECGGWGLMLKTEDLAKFILCCSNEGIYNGKQVLPKAWLSEATSYLTDNSSVEKHADSAAGYGCGFWQCAGMKNTYRCEGMFCQYAICFKDYNACLVMTSDHSDLQETLDIIWEFMPKAFCDASSLKSGSPKIELPDQSNVRTARRQSTEAQISGKHYKIKRCNFINFIGFPVSVFPMPVTFFAHERGGNMDNLCFEFDFDGLFFSWEEDGGYKNKLYLNMNGKANVQKIKIGELNLDVRAFAYWKNKNTLVLNIRPLCAVAVRILEFRFDDDKIKMIPSTIPSTDEKAKKVGDKLKCILIGRFFHWWIDFLVPKVGRILNPVHKGKIVKK